MTDSIYKQVEQFVIDRFTEAGDIQGISHFLRTVHWLNVLQPDADEALLIAAVAHDIERAFRNHEAYDKIKNHGSGYRSHEHLTYHQEEGARIIIEYLEQMGVDQKTVERVRMLVSRHEIGGNDDQNLLKDADSISFFENNVGYFLTQRVRETGIRKVRDKFDWMYQRITSDKAKQLARQGYEQAIQHLQDQDALECSS